MATTPQGTGNNNQHNNSTTPPDVDDFHFASSQLLSVLDSKDEALQGSLLLSILFFFSVSFDLDGIITSVFLSNYHNPTSNYRAVSIYTIVV